jgi:hypothetical protein
VDFILSDDVDSRIVQYVSYHITAGKQNGVVACKYSLVFLSGNKNVCKTDCKELNLYYKVGQIVLRLFNFVPGTLAMLLLGMLGDVKRQNSHGRSG